LDIKTLFLISYEAFYILRKYLGPF